jgi:hypothetical protein
MVCDFAGFDGQRSLGGTEDFILCKQEDRDPAHCLKEGRRVTRCAADLYVCSNVHHYPG